MLTIRDDAALQTVITTFEMTPGTCQDLLDALESAYDEFISKQPGFIAKPAAHEGAEHVHQAIVVINVFVAV